MIYNDNKAPRALVSAAAAAGIEVTIALPSAFSIAGWHRDLDGGK